MTDQIQPAMSAELWKEWTENKALIFANPDLPIADVDGWLSVLGEWEHKLDAPDRHALAAVCLHQQPVGFTRGDVENLRHVGVSPACGPMRGGALLNLAKRIEALLPPDEPANVGEGR